MWALHGANIDSSWVNFDTNQQGSKWVVIAVAGRSVVTVQAETREPEWVSDWFDHKKQPDSTIRTMIRRASDISSVVVLEAGRASSEDEPVVRLGADWAVSFADGEQLNIPFRSSSGANEIVKALVGRMVE